MAGLRVVATLGPATEDDATLQGVVRHADELRLNASHLTAQALGAWLRRLARAFEGLGHARPVVVDLQGAKMRLGTFDGPRHLSGRVELVHATRTSEQGGPLPVPHGRLFAAVSPGETLSLNDRRVELRVLEASGERLAAEVVRAGPVASRQGVNRQRHPIPLDRLTPQDEAAIRVATEFGFTQLALSFVHTGAEIALVRQHTLRSCAAKLERTEALAHIEAIAGAFDELWLCRGDLGAQAGLRALGPLQGAVAEAIPTLGRPVLLAGQVLHHMCSSPRATRSEIVHLYDASQRGFAGVVLSDETAVGAHPLAALQLLAQLGHGPLREACRRGETSS